MAELTYTVVGYSGCQFHNRATRQAQALAADTPGVKAEVVTLERSKYQEYIKEKLKSKGIVHSTSPAVWLGSPDDGQFIGGASEFNTFVKREHPESSAAQPPPSAGCCIVM